MSVQTDQGVIDAIDRVLANLLAAPSFKNSLRIVLDNIDPDASRRLVRTIMWQDTEFALSLVAVTPYLANALIQSGDELLLQMAEKFPRPMLAGFLADALQDVDQAALARLRENAERLYRDLSPVIEKAFTGVQTGDSAGPGVAEGESPAGVGNRQTSALTMPEDGDGHGGTGARPAPAGVVAELIRTPFLKDMLRESLNSINPEQGTAMAKALLWEDMETVFSFMGALPAVINFYINMAAAFGDQLAEKIPPQLFVAYSADIIKDIDVKTARQALATYKELGRKLLAADAAAVDDRVAAILTHPTLVGALAGGVNNLLGAINRLEDRQPGMMKTIMANVTAGIDKQAVHTATRRLTEAVIAQKPPFFSMAWKAVKLYVVGFFKRQP